MNREQRRLSEIGMIQRALERTAVVDLSCRQSQAYQEANIIGGGIVAELQARIEALEGTVAVLRDELRRLKGVPKSDSLPWA